MSVLVYQLLNCFFRQSIKKSKTKQKHCELFFPVVVYISLSSIVSNASTSTGSWKVNTDFWTTNPVTGSWKSNYTNNNKYVYIQIKTRFWRKKKKRKIPSSW